MHLAHFFLCSNSDPPWWLAAIVRYTPGKPSLFPFPFFFFHLWCEADRGTKRVHLVKLKWDYKGAFATNDITHIHRWGEWRGGEGRSHARNRGCLLRCAHLCAVRGLSLCWDLNRSLPFIQWKLWLLVVGQKHVRYMLMLWGLSPETVNGCQLCFCRWLWIGKFIWRAPKRLLMLLIGISVFPTFHNQMFTIGEFVQTGTL